MGDRIHEGGCECGALRYQVTGEPYETGYCHCVTCRRTSGAPVQAFARVKEEQFRYIKGEPKIYYSSDWGQREFCDDCGSQLTYRARQAPHDVAFNTPTLDDPSIWPPERHVWHHQRISWFEVKDNLPRNAK